MPARIIAASFAAIPSNVFWAAAAASFSSGVSATSGTRASSIRVGSKRIVLLCTGGSQGFDALPHALVVAALPVDAPAFGAAPEVVVKFRGARRNAIPHRVRRYILKYAVAAEAAGERAHATNQME